MAAWTLDRALLDLEPAMSFPSAPWCCSTRPGWPRPARRSGCWRPRSAPARRSWRSVTPASLPSVQAGGWMRAVGERVGVHRLTRVMRQRDVDERRALAQLHDGRPWPYLRWAQEQERVAVHIPGTRACPQRCAGARRRVARTEAAGELPSPGYLVPRAAWRRNPPQRKWNRNQGIAGPKATPGVRRRLGVDGQRLRPSSRRSWVGHRRGASSPVSAGRDGRTGQGARASPGPRGQAVATGRLQPPVAGEFGDEHEVVACAHEPGHKRMTQHVRRQLEPARAATRRTARSIDRDDSPLPVRDTV